MEAIAQTHQARVQARRQGEEGWTSGLGYADETVWGVSPLQYCRRQRTQYAKGIALFLHYSLASAAELENQLVLATDVEALYQWHVSGAIDQNAGTMKMLKGLIKRIDPDAQ